MLPTPWPRLPGDKLYKAHPLPPPMYEQLLSEIAFRHGRGRKVYSLIPKGETHVVSPAGSVGRWTRATGTQRPLCEPPPFWWPFYIAESFITRGDSKGGRQAPFEMRL